MIFRRIARRLRALLRITAVVAELEARVDSLEETIEKPPRRRVGGRGGDASPPQAVECQDCIDPDELEALSHRPSIAPTALISPEKAALRQRAAQLGLLAPQGRRRAL